MEPLYSKWSPLGNETLCFIEERGGLVTVVSLYYKSAFGTQRSGLYRGVSSRQGCFFMKGSTAYMIMISLSSFANRAKNIKNKAHINEDPKDAMLREFQKEIFELKLMLDEGTHS